MKVNIGKGAIIATAAKLFPPSFGAISPAAASPAATVSPPPPPPSAVPSHSLPFRPTAHHAAAMLEGSLNQFMQFRYILFPTQVPRSHSKKGKTVPRSRSIEVADFETVMSQGPQPTQVELYRVVHKKGTVLLSTSLAWPAVAGCSRAETFSQPISISFAQPCSCFDIKVQLQILPKLWHKRGRKMF